MTLSKIKTMKKERGFTIVELLIVIVIIAILAAITIVAYNGIQQRARDAGRQSDITNLSKALTAYSSDGNAWPLTHTAAKTALDAYTTANISEAVTDKLVASAPGPSSTATDVYGYEVCSTTGAKLTWYKEQTPAVQTVTVGTGCS
jgi:prepilin-type N-terminal cleavage/methylation domain-containing protein